MKVFDFSADSPSRLMAECEPEDLYAAVKALPKWTARALEITGAALAYWASTALASPKNRQGVGELRSLIRRLQVIQPIAQQDSALDVSGHYRQWNGMVAVLEARAHLSDRHRDIAEIESRAHMKELCALLQPAGDDGLATQVPLQSLGLPKARLSQVLALAEAAGLIHRRKQGAEKRVSAAGSWAAAPAPVSAADRNRGSIVQISTWRGSSKLAA